jgi:prefoldin subunit 5
MDDEPTVQSETTLLQTERDSRSKRKVAAIGVGIAVAVIAIGALCFWYFQAKAPYDHAVENYNKAIEGYSATIATLKEKNTELENSIASLRVVIESGEKPLDDTLLVSAGEAIIKAQNLVVTVPEMPAMPTEPETINTAAGEIDANAEAMADQGDYRKIIAELAGAQQALETSIEQGKQRSIEGLEFGCH